VGVPTCRSALHRVRWPSAEWRWRCSYLKSPMTTRASNKAIEGRRWVERASADKVESKIIRIILCKSAVQVTEKSSNQELPESAVEDFRGDRPSRKHMAAEACGWSLCS
jgi:hypothetical protein